MAVEEQESWRYLLPEVWHIPMTECLGQVYNDFGNYSEAENAFNRELKT